MSVAAAAPPPRPTEFAPAAPGERLQSVDVLRGVAVLGILAMNIYAFAMPFQAYANPSLHGGDSGADYGTWVATHLLFDQKFMTIFSMLFGAGLVLMAGRAEARGVGFVGVYYARMLWLGLFGLVHAYLLWFGDILFYYAVCGLVLYPLRKLSPRVLIAIGIPVVAVAMLSSVGLGLVCGMLRDAGERVARQELAGEPVDETDRELAEVWGEMRAEFEPDRETIEEQIEIHRGGWLRIARERIEQVLMMQTMMLALFFFWRISGLMLIGMALMKLGVFSARRSTGFYRTCVVVGYGLGLPLAALSAYAMTVHRFDAVKLLTLDGHLNYVGSVLVALGHVGLTMLVCRGGLLPGLRRRLAAVGRMALTNYLMQSVLLTTVFYGYGLGLYGQVDRFAQMGFVLAVWALQLAWSAPWLARFRFGPAEWLWRSLTYRRTQPMLRV